MSLNNLGEPSKYWPWIKAIANPLTIPGTKIGLQAITELQDDLADDQFQDKVLAMLEVIYLRTADITQRLRSEEQLEVQDDALRAAAQELAGQFYLRQLAAKFFYADFKGIEQQSKFVSLPLDEVFVDLKVAPEESAAKQSDAEKELRSRLDQTDGADRESLLRELEELDTKRGSRDPAGEVVHLGAILREPGGGVLLGGPGSGKTTLVKRLARSCALGAEISRERYPEMPLCFPVVIPVTQFDTERGSAGLLDFVESRMKARGGEALLACYREHMTNGRVLLLCDGLDEVADAAHRIGAARAVDEAISALGRNRLLLTSRRVGYAICRLTVPAAHHVVQPFTEADVTKFARQWHRAYESVAHPQAPDLPAAEKEAETLIQEIRGNESVARLATNPLMLTIIALIKHQNKRLPDRRVELYELALKTLVASWNLARSLSDKPAGKEHASYEQTRDLWAVVAHWMHATANREVNREKLQAKLEEVLIAESELSPFEAKGVAASYLEAATETSGLLEARGPNTFAFVHQSYQEYLAAMHLARPAAKAAVKIRALSHDPRWAEITRLAAGHLGVTAGEREALAEVIQGLLDCSDPLEPILGTSLRLALGCLEDKVGVRAAQVDQVLARAAEVLGNSPHFPVQEALWLALRPLTVAPGNASIRGWLKLLNHDRWQIRMEVARLLSRAPSSSAEVVQALERVFAGDEDPDVRAHAAWGLWRQAGRRDAEVFAAVAHGLQSSHAAMKVLPDSEMVHFAAGLLAESEAEARWRGAATLGQWGQQATALPALVQLLKEPDEAVRRRAAATLGQWGQQATALPVLIQLLKDPDPDVRRRAAATLGQWRPQATAVPALIQLLKDPEADVRWRTAGMLGQWGQRATALPALIQLLKQPEAEARWRAAVTLGQWGQQATALPALVRLLKEPDADLRQRAAATLGQWEPQATALPVLFQLLKDPDPDVRRRTAGTLGRWGQMATALPALIQLLKDPEADVRWRTAETLGQSEPQATALPALVQLLKDPNADVRRRAAATLGQWLQRQPGLFEEMIHLTGLNLTGWENVTDREANSTPAARLALAQLVTPRPEDSPLIQQIRELAFGLVWRQCAMAS